MRGWWALWATVGLMAGCARQDAGTPPELLLVDAKPSPVSRCPGGATRVTLALDLNGNSWIDPQEPSLHRDLCGLPLQLRLSAVPAQPACRAGGVWVDAGPSSRLLWCHSLGAPADRGVDTLPGDEPERTGPVRLVQVDADPQGLCPVTGRRVASGLDLDRNGRLDPDETLLVQHLCADEEPPPQQARAPQADDPRQARAPAPDRPVIPTHALPVSAPLGQLLQLEGPRGQTWTVAQAAGHRITVAPDGRLAAAGGWQSQTGPDHGDLTGRAAVTALAAAADGRQLLMATREALWQSDDGGQQWTPAGLDAQVVWSAAALSADGRHRLASAPGDGLYGSQDGGRSWQRLSLGLGPLALALSGDGRQALAVRMGGQLVASPDGGAHWQPVGVPGPWATVALSADAQTGLAASADGRLLRSHDGGRVWHLGPAPRGVTGLAVSRDGRTVVAYGRGADGPLHVSRDGGRQWSAVELPRRAEAVHSVALCQAGQRWLVATSEGLTWSTADSGRTWQREPLQAAARAVALSAEGLVRLALDDRATLHRASAATTPGARGTLQVATGPGVSLRHLGTGVWAVVAGSGELHAR
jgi:photosystem II stability/assembly factor-like uncharacterized protein